jgi:hypothetical protein
MNKLGLVLVILGLQFSISRAQIQNVNPDKNGEPWIVGGLRVPTDEEISKIPVLENLKTFGSKELPSSFDNSTQPYFRPIFNQTGGSCGQASGVGYLFTYEINRLRGTSANTTSNQFPTHYTYNFLNGGSAANGSWMTDGWEIIKASGCPTVATYGGIAASETFWMSGYDNYTSGMNNRVRDMFTINVGTPEGLETLKYWIYDHLDGSAVGSVVNFAAGISNTGYQESGFKVVSWGYPINHAMTFVGWDDAIEYDFNGDGLITNTIDINGDQIVDMRDWERGAMIMVNSWSTGWMNGGKAYVMYKLLADAAENGGIHANKVYGINVKETQESQLFLKLKMTHNVRNQIQIKAGVSGNVSSSVPEFVLNFPLFNHQGGEYNMRGSGNTTPIEISLDVTTLLNTVTSGTDAKYFLQIVEDDPYSLGTGMIYDFSIVDAAGNEYISSTHNVPVADNTITQLEVIASIPFDAPQITTVSIPSGGDGESYSYQLEAAGGTSPYIWSIQIDYDESTLSENYPDITATELTPSDYDDGYAVQAIDFDFPFYGELYNQFTVCTDGSLLFEEGFEYLRTNEAIMSTKMIGVFASDLMIFPASGDGIFYEGDANSATFRWKTSLFGDENANIDAALTLYPSGEMKFYYGSNITEGISWAAGISNGEGSYTISSISGNFSPSDLQYQMSSNPFPCGMTISGEGIFSGITPAVAGSWDINFKVLDNNNLASYKSLNFTTITTSVEDINDRFLQISPVPCTDVATITYQLESETPVWISVYDISGKLVAVLKNSVEPAGEYQINWSPMESKGIYFIDLKTNRYHLTKRIAVINN